MDVLGLNSGAAESASASVILLSPSLLNDNEIVSGKGISDKATLYHAEKLKY